MALGSPELRHLPAIEDELSQPMTEQSRMTSNIFPDLKLYPKEEGDNADLTLLNGRLFTRNIIDQAGDVASTPRT